MTRRRRTGALEDGTDLIAKLPWWAGVGLAMVFYAFLSAAAASSDVAPMLPGQMGEAVGGTIIRAVASIAQYLIPALCLVGAAMSAWRRAQRKALVADVAAGNAAWAIDGMSWREFELLVGEAFRLRGFQVVETGGAGADGGVDLVLRRDKETRLVQCKQWRAMKVGVDVVRQLYGVMAARGAAGGYVVTSGRFTDQARRFAEGRNVSLIDGEGLTKLLAQVSSAREARGVARPSGRSEDQPAHPAPSSTAAPKCPRCRSEMVRRVARRGGNAGQAFWGCVSYPACRGIRAIE